MAAILSRPQCVKLWGINLENNDKTWHADALLYTYIFVEIKSDSTALK